MLTLIKHGSKLDFSEEIIYKPIFKNGRFENCWVSEKAPSLIDVLKWKFIPNSARKTNPPVQDVSINVPKFSSSGIYITWLGHSTLVISINGINILTDPIFSDYASPLPLSSFKRLVKCPCTIDQLPNINIIIISHNHYDHLDKYSCIKLKEKFPEAHWILPKNLSVWLQSLIENNNYPFNILNIINFKTNASPSSFSISEMTWWDYQIFVNGDTVIEIVFLPAQHWCKRSINDYNKVLWGSWAISIYKINNQGKFDYNLVDSKQTYNLKECKGLALPIRIYFAGDTGFCETLFDQIHKVIGDFDFCALPIGAYEPRWIMKQHHINPEEAVMVHKILHSKASMGIHWGTFCLSDEPLLEPPERLRKACIEKGVSETEFFTVKHGESRVIK